MKLHKRALSRDSFSTMSKYVPICVSCEYRDSRAHDPASDHFENISRDRSVARQKSYPPMDSADKRNIRIRKDRTGSNISRHRRTPEDPAGSV